MPSFQLGCPRQQQRCTLSHSRASCSSFQCFNVFFYFFAKKIKKIVKLVEINCCCCFYVSQMTFIRFCSLCSKREFFRMYFFAKKHNFFSFLLFFAAQFAIQSIFTSHITPKKLNNIGHYTNDQLSCFNQTISSSSQIKIFTYFHLKATSKFFFSSVQMFEI